MQLDWFTLVAQIVNFLILVWLLKHFLYSRIVRVMDDREKHIAAQLEEAEQKQKQADLEAENYRNQQAELEESQQQMLDQARQEADEQRKQLLKDARHDVEQQKSAWQTALKQDQEQFLQTLQEQTRKHVSSIASKVLRDLADADLESQIAHIFVQRLRNLDAETRDKIFSGKNGQENTFEVRSAFELPEELQEQIIGTVEDLAGQEPEIRFTTVPELVSGIELSVHGMKVGWSMNDYIESLEQAWTAELEQQTRA